jgi:DegV family protein with EDD domain
MNNYVIVTDSACDLSIELLKKLGVPSVALNFMFDNKEPLYNNYDMSAKDFYNKMREGHIAKTSAANAEAFKEVFEGPLKDGYDGLYVGFTSGLSTTFNSGRMAAEEMMEAYPDRKVIAVDTLAASAGQGLMVKLACDKKNAGATIEETAAYLESIRDNMCHWVTVEDLVYLKRGGRISATSAFVGGMLSIKPILHVDNDGRLVNTSKVRGRKLSLKTIADKYEQTALDKKGTVFISHGDCMDDAKAMKKMLEERGANVELITEIGPVVGAHAGPGTIAVFFLGSEK